MTGFSLYPRKRKSGKPVFYVRYKRNDGSYNVAQSTGQTTRRAAEKWAFEHLHEINHTEQGKKCPSLSVFSRDFFLWESPWCIDKRASGKRISPRECLEKTRILNNHVLPALGIYDLDELDTVKIKEFRNSLFQKGKSGSFINKCLIIVRAILIDAEEKGFIRAIPRIQRAAEHFRERGTLSITEIKVLFSSRVKWLDNRGRVACMISATVGLRASEIQGLKISDIHIDSLYITVSKAFDEKMRTMNTTTKNGHVRNVAISRTVAAEIQNLMNEHPAPCPSAFLFWADIKDDKPCERRIFGKSFIDAMNQIGIRKEQQKERNLVFHGLRHFANSLFINSGLPLLRVQEMIGHRSDEMSRRYLHEITDNDDIRAIQDGLFSGLETIQKAGAVE